MTMSPHGLSVDSKPLGALQIVDATIVAMAIFVRRCSHFVRSTKLSLTAPSGLLERKAGIGKKKNRIHFHISSEHIQSSASGN